VTGSDGPPASEHDPTPDGNGSSPAPTDEELDLETRLVDLEKGRTELARDKEKLVTDKANRGLRDSLAKGALGVMVVQIAAGNAVFVWYGDTNGWEIPGAAISAWLGSTVVQVVAVVLVIMNYLFPRAGPPN
jgi:hypothetical protein